MSCITKSLNAIKSYNPKESIYLKVANEGQHQYLEARRVSWFGRLLMWLGFTSSCMVKVAAYVEKHMESLCLSGEIDIQDYHNPLRTLVARLLKYDDRHPTKIQAQTKKILSIYRKQFTSPEQVSSRYIAIKDNASEVKRLLQSQCRQIDGVEAIVKKMTLDEVSTFANSPEDVFGLCESIKFVPAAKLVYAINFMTVPQIKKLIEAIPNISNMNHLIDAFYNISYLIRSLKTSAEKEILFKDLVSLPCYRNIVFVDSKSQDTWGKEVSDQRTTLDVDLLEFYLLHIFKKTTSFTPHFIVELKSVLETQLDIYGSPNTHCVLQKREFLNKFTDAEQDIMALSLLPYLIQYKDVKLITDILLPDYDRSAALFENMATSSLFKDFCMQMREALPQSDVGYILHLGNITNPKERFERLTHFLNQNLPDFNGSILGDSNGYDQFDPNLLVSIGIALVNILKYDQWKDYPIIHDILSHEALAKVLYLVCNRFNPTFNQNLVKKFCKENNLTNSCTILEKLP